MFSLNRPEAVQSAGELLGSKEWTQLYTLRSAVEGALGNLKNHGTEGVRRGFYQTDGIHMFTLALTAAAACHNIRTIEKLSREQGLRIDHPRMNHPLDDALLENVLLEGAEVIGTSTATHQQRPDHGTNDERP